MTDDDNPARKWLDSHCGKESSRWLVEPWDGSEVLASDQAGSEWRVAVVLCGKPLPPGRLRDVLGNPFDKD